MNLSNTFKKLTKIGGVVSPFYKVNDCFPMYKLTTIPVRESRNEISNKYFMTQLFVFPGAMVYVNPITLKSRVSKAMVFGNIFFEFDSAGSLDYQCNFTTTYSMHDPHFKYQINKIIEPHYFFDYTDWLKTGMRDASCKPGIHAFFTKKEAELYNYDEMSGPVSERFSVYFRSNQDLICEDC